MPQTQLEQCLNDIAAHANTALGFAQLLTHLDIPAEQSLKDAKTVEDRLDRIIIAALKAKAHIKQYRER